jgi:SAM-dependent methyltransferase
VSALGQTPDLASRVAEIGVWYHTLELAPSVVTPGWFDMRPVVDRMPWPDVRGLRCLDVGTYDGYLAFELERRGASEVVAQDIAHHRDWDWPPELAARGPEHLARLAGQKGAGFALAGEALRSKVQRMELSVYDLSPQRAGEFDVVVCGSLLLHLRDPLRALAAIASVCRGQFMSAEQIDPGLTLLHRRRALANVFPSVERLHWWEPNAAGHRRMLEAAGFEILRASRPYPLAFGSGHPRPRPSLRLMRTRAVRRLATGGQGVPHAAVLARPRFR